MSNFAHLIAAYRDELLCSFFFFFLIFINSGLLGSLSLALKGPNPHILKDQVLVCKLQFDTLELCLRELNTSGICNFDLLKLISKKNVN